MFFQQGVFFVDAAFVVLFLAVPAALEDASFFS